VGSDAVIVAGASRPYPGETANGDAWAIHRHAGAGRIALVDGLGHGPEAAAAAQAALTTLAARPELGPSEAIRACHAALGGTRGAVVVVAQVDATGRHLTVAGIGNAEMRVRQGGREERPISYRGIVGRTMPTVRAFAIELGSDWLLLLHTDGVRSSLELGAAIGSDPEGLRADAQGLLDRWARRDDDATVVLAAPGRSGADASERPAPSA
jgi:hypothetical protein